MNKKILFLALVMVFLLPCVFSCQKRDKLTANTMLVSIEPKTIPDGIKVGDAQNLSAFVRNAKYESVTPDSVSWSVEPSDLGSFDDTSAPNTVFRATKTGTGKIILVCEGIQTSLDLTVK